jgi:hypothetical protein
MCPSLRWHGEGTLPPHHRQSIPRPPPSPSPLTDGSRPIADGNGEPFVIMSTKSHRDPINPLVRVLFGHDLVGGVACRCNFVIIHDPCPCGWGYPWREAMVVVIWLGGLMFRQLLGMRLDQRLFCYLELFLARLCSAYRSRELQMKPAWGMSRLPNLLAVAVLWMTWLEDGSGRCKIWLIQVHIHFYVTLGYADCGYYPWLRWTLAVQTHFVRNGFSCGLCKKKYNKCLVRSYVGAPKIVFLHKWHFYTSDSKCHFFAKFYVRT